jgi:DNA-binding transcriptional ArsR family regulator
LSDDAGFLLWITPTGHRGLGVSSWAVTDVFRALAHPARFRIIEILALGEHSAGNLSEVIQHEFGISPSAVSQQLRVLRDLDTVLVRVAESNRIYRLNPAFLNELDVSAGALFDLWDQRYGWAYRNDDLPPDKPSWPQRRPPNTRPTSSPPNARLTSTPPNARPTSTCAPGG